jgi:hypothetical protein
MNDCFTTPVQRPRATLRLVQISLPTDVFGRASDSIFNPDHERVTLVYALIDTTSKESRELSSTSTPNALFAFFFHHHNLAKS